MTIRPITSADDFNAIAQIYVASWRAAYKDIIPSSYLEALSAEAWEERLRDRVWNGVVLLEDGKYLGTSAFGAARDVTLPGWGEIVSLYVRPECFGKGYGMPLMQAVKAELTASGYREIYLWTLEANARARAFYRKSGFREDGGRMSMEIGGETLWEVRYVYP